MSGERYREVRVRVVVDERGRIVPCRVCGDYGEFMRPVTLWREGPAHAVCNRAVPIDPTSRPDASGEESANVKAGAVGVDSSLSSGARACGQNPGLAGGSCSMRGGGTSEQ